MTALTLVIVGATTYLTADAVVHSDECQCLNLGRSVDGPGCARAQLVPRPYLSDLQTWFHDEASTGIKNHVFGGSGKAFACIVTRVGDNPGQGR